MNKKELSAYAYQCLHFHFYKTIMWLENFIEQANWFDNWEERKQTDTTAIQWKNKMTLEKSRNVFSVCLLIFSGDLEDDLREKENSFLIKELQQELYKWINSFGITAENCPNYLKSVIFEFHEIIKGNIEKILSDEENRKRELEPNDPRYFEVVIPVWQTEKQKAQNIEGKKWNEIEIETRFKGNAEAGKKTFQEIADSLVNHQDFYFVEQKDGKGKWKPEATKTIIKAQKSELESGKTKYEKSQSHSIILWLILAIIGIIILLIGWMTIWKKSKPKKHGKL